MSASRNEATGDVLANVKGSARAFEEGMNYAANPPTDWVYDINQSRILMTQEEADEMNAMPVPLVPPLQRVTWRVGDNCPWRRAK